MTGRLVEPGVVFEHPDHLVRTVAGGDLREATVAIEADSISAAAGALAHLHRPDSEPVDVMALLEQRDLVELVAVPDTHHLIDRGALAAMKPDAVLVNVARGSLVEEDALIEALESGHLSAAALDVFEHEPLPAASPIWYTP